MSVTIRFVQGTAFASRLIVAQEKTAMPFTPSHVEALTADGKFCLGAHDDGGVAKRAVGYDAGAVAHDLQLVVDLLPDQEAKFWAYLESKIGEPYDWRAIIGFVIPGHAHDLDHAICSALITLALRAAGWFEYRLAAPAHLIDPRDLLLMLSAKMQIPGV